MGVLQVLQRTSGVLKRVPGLLVPQPIVFALLVPQLLLQSSYPLASMLYSLGISVVFPLVTSFIQGSVFGTVDEVLTTRSSPPRFVADERASYLSSLIAYVLLLVVNGVIGAAGVMAGFGVLLMYGSTGTAFIGLAAIVEPLYLVVAFFAQSYSQTIVIDGAFTIDSLERSYHVVRGNPLTTVGYMLLVLVTDAPSGDVYTGASLLASADIASVAGLPTLLTPFFTIVGPLAMVIGSVVSAFLLAFSVAAYDGLTGWATARYVVVRLPASTLPRPAGQITNPPNGIGFDGILLSNARTAHCLLRRVHFVCVL